MIKIRIEETKDQDGMLSAQVTISIEGQDGEIIEELVVARKNEIVGKTTYNEVIEQLVQDQDKETQARERDELKAAMRKLFENTEKI